MPTSVWLGMLCHVRWPKSTQIARTAISTLNRMGLREGGVRRRALQYLFLLVSKRFENSEAFVIYVVCFQRSCYPHQFNVQRYTQRARQVVELKLSLLNCIKDDTRSEIMDILDKRGLSQHSGTRGLCVPNTDAVDTAKLSLSASKKSTLA